MSSISSKVSRRLYNSVARHLPESKARNGLYRKIRTALVKRFIAYCGTNVNIEKGAMFESSVEIGDFSGIGINARIQGKVVIGKYVMMGPECIIYTLNHAFSRIDIPMIRQGFRDQKPVTIGDDVWIGARVIILPGVRIGKGAVIGAGAVVTKSVQDYSIVGGNPAKLIRTRRE